MKDKQILFIRLRSLGDTLLMTPAIELASAGGLNRVAVVVEEPFDQVLRGNPHVDRIIVPRGRGELWSRWKCIREIRSFNPDIVFDMHGGTTSALMTLFSRSGMRVGFAGSRNSRSYNVKVPDARSLWGKSNLHTVEYQLSPLIHMGFKLGKIPPLKITVDDGLREKIGENLAGKGVKGEFVLIHPAAAFATKQWSVDGFSVVADELGRRGIKCVATAGPGQEILLDELSSAAGEDLVIYPPGTLREFTALASLCALYLGNDTGPTHIAAALKKKVVAVFGSSNHMAWHPWGTDYRLIRSDLPCVPCPGYKCLHYPEPECILSIQPGQVLEAVLDLLPLS